MFHPSCASPPVLLRHRAHWAQAVSVCLSLSRPASQSANQSIPSFRTWILSVCLVLCACALSVECAVCSAECKCHADADADADAMKQERISASTGKESSVSVSLVVNGNRNAGADDANGSFTLIRVSLTSQMASSSSNFYFRLLTLLSNDNSHMFKF